MTDLDERLWPFRRKASLLSVAVILPGLLSLTAILRRLSAWPSAQAESGVLIGIVALSLLPLLLAVLDTIMERGAVIEYGHVKVDFSQSREMGTTGLTVAANIGVAGQAVTDSGTTQILEALRQATANDVVVVDLEEGDAWWETRLLVLLAGAERLKRPEKVVFVGTDGGRNQRFQGWANADTLLGRLVRANPQYERSLQAARAAALQWELVGPVDPAPAGGYVAPPQLPPWLGILANQHQWMAIDPRTGLRNEFLAEQLLQSDLGQKIEHLQGSVKVTLVRLEELFRPVLNRDAIDLTWPEQRQLDAFLKSESLSIAVTQDGRYSTLAPRLTLMAQLLKPMVKQLDHA